MSVHDFYVSQNIWLSLAVELPDDVDPRSDVVHAAIARFVERDRERHAWIHDEEDGTFVLEFSEDEKQEGDYPKSQIDASWNPGTNEVIRVD